MKVTLSFVLYHLLFAALAALAFSGCATTGGSVLPTSTGTANWWPGGWWTTSNASPDAQASNDKTGKPSATPKENASLFVSRMAKGRDTEQQGKLDKAREIYDELIKRFPERYEPYHRLGVVADRQKRYVEAQDLLEQALRMKPDHPEIVGDLAYNYFLQGKLTQAEETARLAVELSPRDDRKRNNLGLILGHQGRMPEALDQFRRCGSEADAQYNLAFVYASRNDAEAAKACFQRALVADPSYEKAREALASFRVYENQPEELRRMADAMAFDDQGTIPYIEGGTDGTVSDDGAAPIGATSDAGGRGQVSTASHSAPHMVTPRHASNATRSLFQQSRSQIQQPLSNVRGEGGGDE